MKKAVFSCFAEQLHRIGLFLSDIQNEAFFRP
jgi:hypothetical protein